MTEIPGAFTFNFLPSSVLIWIESWKPGKNKDNSITRIKEITIESKNAI